MNDIENKKQFDELTDLFRIMFRISLKYNINGLPRFLDDLDRRLDRYIEDG